MKLRERTLREICNSNNLNNKLIYSNVVEEYKTKNKIRATSDLIAKTLIGTLGPYGTSTIIQDPQRNHFATKDGYDVMNRLDFDDPVSKTILDLLRTTSSNQVLNVGDGSTSAIVVSNALYQALTDPEQQENFKKIAPKDILDALHDLGEMLEHSLADMAKPVSEDMRELDIIGAVSTNNDKESGKLIADIYRKIGKYGFITQDVMNKQEHDTVEYKRGIEWSRGYEDVDPIFALSAEDGIITYDENPRIIISNSQLTFGDLENVLLPLMKVALNQENAQLLIIANDFDEDVKTFLKANRTKHMSIQGRSTSVPMDFTAVDIDQVTRGSREKLEDLALLCGCKIYDKFTTTQKDLESNFMAFIGHATKAIIGQKKTQIICDIENNPEIHKVVTEKVKEYTKEIEKIKKNSEMLSREEDEKIESLTNRLIRLDATSAVLHVGGKTLTERLGRHRLFDDAIHACKSALEYGYIPGGNLCIPKLLLENKEAYASVLGTKYDYLPVTDGIRTFFGYFIDMLADAFLESYRAVLNNAYFTETETEEIIYKCLNENKFYNLKLHKYEDFDDTLIINSVRTDIEILRSCISIIGMLSTSNQMITIHLNVADQSIE